MSKTEALKYFDDAVDLLSRIIALPSFSNEEDEVASLWEEWLKSRGVENVNRFYNNIYALASRFDPSKPVLLLNSHLDTVRPVSSWTRDPFYPQIHDGILYGLGSNDAGGAGVSLAAVFLKFLGENDLPFNLMLAITASEERMGELGMRAFLPHLREKGLYPEMAIVGEPTECRGAIAERGLVVCDAVVTGKAGHAARSEGINAIYRACADITHIQSLRLPEESEVLGPVKFSVTMIESGTQHNIVPDLCKYVVDVRSTDTYSNEELVEILHEATEWSEFKPRSTRIRASVLPSDNPLFLAAQEIAMPLYVSPTTSDMALMHDIPSIKIGPGKSERSHTADEFITLEEIRKGISTYEKYILALSAIIKNKK